MDGPPKIPLLQHIDGRLVGQVEVSPSIEPLFLRSKRDALVNSCCSRTTHGTYLPKPSIFTGLPLVLQARKMF
jgi:hypothetical protein